MIALILLLSLPGVYSQTQTVITDTVECKVTGGSQTIKCGPGFYCATVVRQAGTGLHPYAPTGTGLLDTAVDYYKPFAYPQCTPYKAPGAACTAATQCGAAFLTPRSSAISGSATTPAYVASSGSVTNTYAYAALTSGGVTGIYTGYQTTCGTNGRCCKSFSCTGACDSDGNCMTDATTLCTAGAVTTTSASGVLTNANVLAGSTTFEQSASTCAITYFKAVVTAGYSNYASVDGKYTSDAILCAKNFYGSPQANPPIPCLPCPTDAVTLYAGATNINQCMCPAGTYLDMSSGYGSGSTTSYNTNAAASGGSTTTTVNTLTNSYAGTLDFAKCTACPTGSTSTAFPVTTSLTIAGAAGCRYTASSYANELATIAKLTEQYAMQQTQYALQQTQYALANNSFVLQTAQYVMQTAQFALANTAFALQTSDFYLNGNWSSTQNAFNTVFRESNNGQLGTQSSIFAFVVIIVLILVFMQFFDIVMRVLTCKCIARSPKSPVTPAPSVTVTAQA